MRLSLVLSVLRPAGPVAIGVSLGFTLSLLSVTWVEEPCGPPPRPATRPHLDGGPAPPPGPANGNAARRPNAVPAALGTDNWEPRVVPYRPPSPGRAAKKAVRCGGAGPGRAGGLGPPLTGVYLGVAAGELPVPALAGLAGFKGGLCRRLSGMLCPPFSHLDEFFSLRVPFPAASFSPLCLTSR